MAMSAFNIQPNNQRNTFRNDHQYKIENITISIVLNSVYRKTDNSASEKNQYRASKLPQLGAITR